MEDRHVPVQADCPSDALDGHLVLPDLVRNHTQKMQRVGLIGLDGEDLPVDLLGSLQLPSLVVLDRHRQCLGDRCHAQPISFSG